MSKRYLISKLLFKSSLILLLFVQKNVNSQETKEYSGNYEDGTAKYSYYISDEGQRVFHGSFSYSEDQRNVVNYLHQERSVYTAVGFFKDGKKTGKWTFERTHFTNDVQDFYKKTEAEYEDGLYNGKYSEIKKSDQGELTYNGNYLNGDKNGIFEVKETELSNLHEPVTKIITCEFKNNYLVNNFNLEYDEDYHENGMVGGTEKRVKCFLKGKFKNGFYDGQWTGTFVKTISYGHFRAMDINMTFDEGLFIKGGETDHESGVYTKFSLQYFYNISNEELQNFPEEIVVNPANDFTYWGLGPMDKKLSELLGLPYNNVSSYGNKNDHGDYLNESAWPRIKTIRFVTKGDLVKDYNKVDSIFKLVNFDFAKLKQKSEDYFDYTKTQKFMSAMEIHNLRKSEPNRKSNWGVSYFDLKERQIIGFRKNIDVILSGAEDFQEKHKQLSLLKPKIQLIYDKEFSNDFLQVREDSLNDFMAFLILTGQIQETKHENTFKETFDKNANSKSNSPFITQTNIVRKYRVDNLSYTDARSEYLKDIGGYKENVNKWLQGLETDYNGRIDAVKQVYQAYQSLFSYTYYYSEHFAVLANIYLKLTKQDLLDVQFEDKNLDDFNNRIIKLEKSKELKELFDLKTFKADFESLKTHSQMDEMIEKYIN